MVLYEMVANQVRRTPSLHPLTASSKRTNTLYFHTVFPHNSCTLQPHSATPPPSHCVGMRGVEQEHGCAELAKVPQQFGGDSEVLGAFRGFQQARTHPTHTPHRSPTRTGPCTSNAVWRCCLSSCGVARD